MTRTIRDPARRDYSRLEPKKGGGRRAKDQVDPPLNGHLRAKLNKICRPLMRELTVLRHFLTQVRAIVGDGGSPQAQRRRIIELIESIQGHEEGPGTWRRLSKENPRGRHGPKQSIYRPSNRVPSDQLMQNMQARREKELIERYGSGISAVLPDWLSGDLELV